LVLTKVGEVVSFGRGLQAIESASRAKEAAKEALDAAAKTLADAIGSAPRARVTLLAFGF